MSQLALEITSLNGDPTTYVPVNQPCRLTMGTSVITADVTNNPVTLTLSDGTTTIGTFTIAAGSAGDVDSLSYSADVELNESTPLKIVASGTPGAGAVRLALNFSDYHVG